MFWASATQGSEIAQLFRADAENGECRGKNGAACQTRTDDLRITNAMLYQLS